MQICAMNHINNRKVKVTFKTIQTVNPVTQEAEAYTRPDMYTTQHNLDHVKRIHGRIFKEAVFVDDNEYKPAQHTQVVEKVVEKVIVKEASKEVTDVDMILALSKKGKTPNWIARTLEIPIEEVNTVLSENPIAA